MKSPRASGFSLIELVFVIVVVAILIGIVIPTRDVIDIKGRQNAAVSNVRQILLACRIYATDHKGEYPAYAVDPVTHEPSVAAGRLSPKLGSNGAFAELFPDYLTNETIFCEQGSAFTSSLADNVIDCPTKATPLETLKKGENTFAYCIGLTDKSIAELPLVGDGFADASQWTYSNDKRMRGGIWEGKKAVMGLVDGSAAIMKVNQATMTVLGNPVDPKASYFSTAVKGDKPWLTAPENVWLNPL